MLIAIHLGSEPPPLQNCYPPECLGLSKLQYPLQNFHGRIKLQLGGPKKDRKIVKSEETYASFPIDVDVNFARNRMQNVA